MLKWIIFHVKLLFVKLNIKKVIYIKIIVFVSVIHIIILGRFSKKSNNLYNKFLAFLFAWYVPLFQAGVLEIEISKST